MTDEDARLLAAAAEDAQAFTLVYRRWQAPLYRYALHMSGSDSLAEDVTQEVFVTLAEHADRFDPAKGHLAGYLFGIARNLLRRRLRREAIYASIVDTDPAAMPEQAFDRQEAIQQVRRAVCTLPVRFREAIVLCDLQELSYADAAAIIGCPVGTVRSRLHRGRQLLAERLRPVVMAKEEGSVRDGR